MPPLPLTCSQDVAFIGRYSFEISLDIVVRHELNSYDQAFFSVRISRSGTDSSPSARLTLNTVTFNLKDRLYQSTLDYVRCVRGGGGACISNEWMAREAAYHVMAHSWPTHGPLITPSCPPHGPLMASSWPDTGNLMCEKQVRSRAAPMAPCAAGGGGAQNNTVPVCLPGSSGRTNYLAAVAGPAAWQQWQDQPPGSQQ